MVGQLVSSTVSLNDDAQSRSRGARAIEAAWTKLQPVAEQIRERTRANVAEHRRLIDSITDKALKASVE